MPASESDDDYNSLRLMMGKCACRKSRINGPSIGNDHVYVRAMDDVVCRLDDWLATVGDDVSDEGARVAVDEDE